MAGVDKTYSELLKEIAAVKSELKVLKKRAGSMDAKKKIDFTAYTEESERLLARKVELSDQLSQLDNSNRGE